VKATKLTNLEVEFVSLVDEPAHQDDRITLTKRERDARNQHDGARTMPTTAPEETVMSKIDLTAIEDEDLRKSVEAVLAEADETAKDLVSRIEALEKQAEDGDEEAPAEEATTDEPAAEADDEVAKAVAKRLADAEAIAKAAVEKAERLEEAARQREFVDRAAVYKNVAGADELGPVLAAVAKAAPEAYERLEHFLKTANERIALTEEIGKAGRGKTDGNAELDNAAAELRKADPTLSREASIAKALDLNPHLYRSPGATVVD